MRHCAKWCIRALAGGQTERARKRLEFEPVAMDRLVELLERSLALHAVTIAEVCQWRSSSERDAFEGRCNRFQPFRGRPAGWQDAGGWDVRGREAGPPLAGSVLARRLMASCLRGRGPGSVGDVQARSGHPGRDSRSSRLLICISGHWNINERDSTFVRNELPSAASLQMLLKTAFSPARLRRFSCGFILILGGGIAASGELTGVHSDWLFLSAFCPSAKRHD